MKKYSLTASQKLLLYFQLLNRKKSDGNVCGSFTIQEKVDFEKLKKAVNFVIEKNDSMRTRICLTPFGFKQYFEDYNELDIEIIDVKTDADVKEIENKINHEVFSMLKTPLLKIKFFKFEDGTGGVVCCMHHIICDAWTVGLAINQIIAYYSGNEEKIIAYPYYEHIKDEHNYLLSEKLKKDKIFWEDLFKDNIPPPAVIPWDLNRIDKSRKSKFFQGHINKETIDSINEYCSKKNITICSFFTGIFSLYIGIDSNLDEFVLDTIISNRANIKDKLTMGLFAGTLPLKVAISGGLFKDYIVNIHSNLLSAYRHYRYPTHKTLEIVKKKEAERKRTSKIWFSFQNARTNKELFKVPYKTRWTPIESTYLYDMLIELYDLENDGSLDITYNYLECKYSASRISKIHNAIEGMINQVLNNNEIGIKDIEIDKSSLELYQ